MLKKNEILKKNMNFKIKLKYTMIPINYYVNNFVETNIIKTNTKSIIKNFKIKNDFIFKKNNYIFSYFVSIFFLINIIKFELLKLFKSYNNCKQIIKIKKKKRKKKIYFLLKKKIKRNKNNFIHYNNSITYKTVTKLKLVGRGYKFSKKKYVLIYRIGYATKFCFFTTVFSLFLKKKKKKKYFRFVSDFRMMLINFVLKIYLLKYIDKYSGRGSQILNKNY